MKKLIASSEKHDLSYQKETFATVVGVVACLVWMVAHVLPISFTSTEFFNWTIPFRIFAAVWVYKISGRQNRDQGGNAILGFLFPGVTLIILGQLKKLNLRFKLDTSASPDIQVKELRQYAKGYIKKARYKEAAFIYQYIVDNLPSTATDVDTLAQLKERVI